MPYFEQTRLRLKVATDSRGLVIFNNFNEQCTDGIFELLEANNINIIIVPANCTDRLQPLDLSFNKPVKTFYEHNLANGIQRKLLHKREKECD